MISTQAVLYTRSTGHAEKYRANLVELNLEPQVQKIQDPEQNPRFDVILFSGSVFFTGKKLLPNQSADISHSDSRDFVRANISSIATQQLHSGYATVSQPCTVVLVCPKFKASATCISPLSSSKRERNEVRRVSERREKSRVDPLLP
jgi:hypothetical protein